MGLSCLNGAQHFPSRRILKVAIEPVAHVRTCQSEICADQDTIAGQQVPQPLNRSHRRREPVKKPDIVIRGKPLHDRIEVALMQGDAVRKAGILHVAGRQAQMRGIHVDRIDIGGLAALREAAGRIAERRSEFEHTTGLQGPGKSGQGRAVLERAGAAAMLALMDPGSVLDMEKRDRTCLDFPYCVEFGFPWQPTRNAILLLPWLPLHDARSPSRVWRIDRSMPASSPPLAQSIATRSLHARLYARAVPRYMPYHCYTTKIKRGRVAKDQDCRRAAGGEAKRASGAHSLSAGPVGQQVRGPKPRCSGSTWRPGEHPTECNFSVQHKKSVSS